MSSVSILWLSVQVAVFSLVGAAVFVLLRRRGLSAAVACAATVLLLTLPFLTLVLSPWPRWELPAKSNESTAAVVAERVAEPAINDPPDLTAIAAPVDFVEEPPQEPALAQWWHNAVDWFQTAQQPAESAVEVQPATWRSWLPWIVAAGVAFGFVRLTVGIWAVRGYRRCSTVVDDADLLQLVHHIASQLGEKCIRPCAPHAPREERKRFSASIERRHQTRPRHHAERDEYTKLEIRETPRLRSAATIGWRRPVLLLPADWRSWTETERRVVIAHELAHIARRDYLLVLVARLVTAIHFYQPLVLWLARQLRVQQELAADAQAAAITGSRQTYLTTLAQMALRADDQPIPWPARAFLPGTGLLVKRVTWLKRSKTTEDRTMNRSSRWILAATMAAVALFVAGIRGPGNAAPPLAVAAEPNDHNVTALAQAAVGGAQPLAQGGTLEIAEFRKNEYVPVDAKVVIAISPKGIGEHLPPAVAKLLTLADTSGLEKTFGMKFANLDDFILVKTTLLKNDDWDRTIVRAKQPHDWKTLLNTDLIPHPTSKKIGDKTYYVSQPPISHDLGPCAYFPDDRTLVLATEEEMREILAGGEKLMDRESFRELASNPFVLQCEGSWLRHAPDPVSIALRPVLDRTERFILAGSFAAAGQDRADAQLGLNLVLDCDSDEGAAQVKATLDAARTLALNIVAEYEKRAPLADPSSPAGTTPAAELIKIGNRLLTDAKTSSENKRVNVQTLTAISDLTIATVVLPAVQASREAARRQHSMNNMKQLALALHNYADTHKRLPPPVVLGKDGKTKHSWRVAILPFLHEEQLYNNYRFDEPWDSEHNRKLLDKMPPQFRDPHDDPKSTNASYFMVTGKGTIGDTERGRMFKEITDGTSGTIMLVDAKRDIPWTKPEDIEVDPDPNKPLPKFGGHLQPEGMFLAAFADGSVRTIALTVDQQLLRRFFTVAGGEPVNAGTLDPPQPQATERKPANGAAIGPARDAARRARSINNMKQIMLGFNKFEDKTRRLPANIRDKNGKPLLSWRVALLPEVEQGELLKEFHLDEPWDSEHNIKLLSKIPAVYRHPKDDLSSTNASYFMPSGEGTIGRNAARTSMGDFADGTSKTIALIEAKRDVPWTKPEDIEIDPDPTKPLRKFGGFFDGLFNAAFTDGHVIAVSDAADPAILRQFFTIAGGETVDEKNLVRPKPADGGKVPVHSGNQSADSGDTNDNAAAARQKENIINLRKIGVALHNYAAAYRHFPPPVIVGADGRTKYSWRVAILPFIEGHAMTVKYRFDEPWDSKHNQKVMAEIPDALRSPFDAPDSTNTSYFMPTGKGAFGDNDEGRVAEEGRVVREITDGMANTIMVVEAKPSVPWTKPEDIEVDPDKPLPKFGGFLPNGLFSASFASGHVRTIPGSVDADALRALFTIAGGEVVDMDAVLNPQRADGNSQTPPVMKPGPAVRLNPARRVRIEFRLGEAQPGEGLAEIELPGQPKVYVYDKAELTSEDIAAVTMIVDTNTNAPGLNILFTPDGAKKMEQLTEANLRKRLVILADGKVLSAPTIRSKISSQAMVTGNFTQEEVVRIVKDFHGE